MKSKRVYLLGTLTFFFCIAIAVPAYDDKSRIVGISIACSNDRVYTWYSDGTVSVGNSENLSAHEPPHTYRLPLGKTPDDIVEIGIASNDRVYTWYKDLTLSVGTSTDLDKYEPRHPYRLPKFMSIDSVVGIDIACSTDHVFVWSRLGQVSSGTSEDLDKYSKKPQPFTPGAGKNPSAVIGTGIAGNDHVYAWFFDHTVSSGTSNSFRAHHSPVEFVLGPGPCDISADAPKLGSRVVFQREEKFVFGVAIRGPECKFEGEILVQLKTAETNPRTLIETKARGVSFETSINFQCKGHGKKTVFTEVSSRGRVVRSPNSTIEGCF